MEVRRVELLGDDGQWAWPLARGVNVIVGPVGVGKTTLLNLIRFGLGGGWEPTKKARESAHSVRLNVRIEDTEMIITRAFGANSVMVDREGIGRRTLTVGGGTTKRPKLSDALLDLLGKDPKDLDYPYYVTAHEVAHQWWAHQVIGANVQGTPKLDGAKVQSITPGMPAADADLKVGDVIRKVDGKPVTGSIDLVVAVRSHVVGEKVTLTVERGKKTFEVKVGLKAKTG